MPEYNAVQTAVRRAREGVELLRQQLQRDFQGRNDLIVGVNGSYARGEVTSGSDVDIFLLGLDGATQYQTDQDRVIEIIVSLGLRPPSPGGVFQKPLYLGDLIKNIGGMQDVNESITRRMLFLLEGEWILNQSGFEDARSKMVSTYVKDSIPNQKICRYLLSDIIRYWRTMCVDYEHKHASGKPPGLRRIKLRFSRCLIYFAGVLAVGETCGMNAHEKREYLQARFRERALERVERILGAQADGLVRLYDGFLADIDSVTLRNRLEAVDYEDSSEYKRLRERAQSFRNELVGQLRNRYPPEHDLMFALLI